MVKRTSEIPPWYSLASQALAHSIAEEYDAVAEVLQTIGREHGDCWPEILYTLIDTMMHTMGIEPEHYGPHMRQASMLSDDPATTPPDVLEAVSWSSALIQARVVNDRAAYYELFAQVHTDEQAGAYFSNLVYSVGMTIRGIQEGALPTPYVVRKEDYTHD